MPTQAIRYAIPCVQLRLSALPFSHRVRDPLPPLSVSPLVMVSPFTTSIQNKSLFSTVCDLLGLSGSGEGDGVFAQILNRCVLASFSRLSRRLSTPPPSHNVPYRRRTGVLFSVAAGLDSIVAVIRRTASRFITSPSSMPWRWRPFPPAMRFGRRRCRHQFNLLNPYPHRHHHRHLSSCMDKTVGNHIYTTVPASI